MSDLPDLDAAWGSLPRAFGTPCASGVMRRRLEDFRVDEVIGFAPDGAGEHLLLQIEKRGANTDWVAGKIARAWDVQRRDVSYAGMKDRRAVTRQWFSVRMSGRPDPDPGALEDAEVRVLEMVRHGRKLRRGALQGNRFTIILRDLEGSMEALEQRLQQIAVRGIPNYFGEQRFGREGGNLMGAARLLSGNRMRLSRQKRGLLLSAARSFLFNRVLAARVEAGTWDTILPGDLMMLDGKRALFPLAAVDEESVARAAELDIHPTGPLCGKGESQIDGEAAQLESLLLEPYADWCDGLSRMGMEQSRRALRVRVGELQWSMERSGQLELSFFLPAGSFATALLRELLQLSTAEEDRAANDPPSTR